MTIQVSRPRGRVFWLGVFVLFLLVIAFFTSYGVASLAGKNVQSRFRVVYSLDRRQNDQEIIRLINAAKRYAYFAVYYFTEPGIADALVRAHTRGVDVRGITDRDGLANSEANRRIYDRLTAAGISVETQRHLDGIMHVKALVTENAYASGSYNWTSAATEANDEILEIGTDPAVHDQYLAIIKKILARNE